MQGKPSFVRNFKKISHPVWPYTSITVLYTDKEAADREMLVKIDLGSNFKDRSLRNMSIVQL